MASEDVQNMSKIDMIEYLKEHGVTKLKRGQSIREAIVEVKQGDSKDHLGNAKDPLYDQKMIHKGYGAPNCYCYIAPPCENCIHYTTQKMLEEDYAK